jgi:hypothetical protein
MGGGGRVRGIPKRTVAPYRGCAHPVLRRIYQVRVAEPPDRFGTPLMRAPTQKNPRHAVCMCSFLGAAGARSESSDMRRARRRSCWSLASTGTIRCIARALGPSVAVPPRQCSRKRATRKVESFGNAGSLMKYIHRGALQPHQNP